MLVYHTTKSRKGLDGIVADRCIQLGRNVLDRKNIKRFAHVSIRRFQPGDWAVQVFGGRIAWILDIEIPDDHPLEPDPSEDDAGEIYGGGWLVSRTPVPILKIHRITYIPHVIRWEEKKIREEEWIDLSIA